MPVSYTHLDVYKRQERIIPGNMVYELLHNNRTIGADDLEVGEEVAKIYATFCQGEISVTDIRTAEMTKVVENTFRAINIAFSNELAKICRIGGMDVAEVIRCLLYTSPPSGRSTLPAPRRPRAPSARERRRWPPTRWAASARCR